MGGSSEMARQQEEVRSAGSFGYAEGQYAASLLLNVIQQVLYHGKAEEAIKLLKTLIPQREESDF